jgi:hypothetical protein
VAHFERDILKPEEVGLRLEESKKVLRGIQDVMVKRQVAGFMKGQRACPQCGQSRPRKGTHEVVYRTLFGKLKLESPRLYRCQCQAKGPRSCSPLAELLSERTAPELLYLETKFAALLPFGVTVELLMEVLPLSHEISNSVIRLADVVEVRL